MRYGLCTALIEWTKSQHYNMCIRVLAPQNTHEAHSNQLAQGEKLNTHTFRGTEKLTPYIEDSTDHNNVVVSAVQCNMHSVTQICR